MRSSGLELFVRQSLVTLSFGINHFFSNMASFFFIFIFFIYFFWSPGTTPDAKIGLWTLSPRCSAVLPHPEPTIDFSDCSAVFPFKSRDVRFPRRHFRSCDFPLSPQTPLSNQNDQRLPFRLATVRTNQKPERVTYEPTLLLKTLKRPRHFKEPGFLLRKKKLKEREN